jgi:hypothetical protein
MRFGPEHLIALAADTFVWPTFTAKLFEPPTWLGFFKPTLRVYKNLRNKMIERGQIEEGWATSYYLEGLLYNVPPDRFGGSQVANLRTLSIG